MIHEGCKNIYSFNEDERSITPAPLTLTQVYENQIKLKSEEEKILREIESKREYNKVTSSEKKE